MGRYAFFNTGLEYKVAFGVQKSTDILEFYGWYSQPDDIDVTHSISWSEESLQSIQTTLSSMHTRFGIEDFDVSSFEKNLEGTYKLKYAFQDKYPFITEYHYLLLLGYLIAHQLSYQPDLYCEFET
jgi:hypothetical protein